MSSVIMGHLGEFQSRPAGKKEKGKKIFLSSSSEMFFLMFLYPNYFLFDLNYNCLFNKLEYIVCLTLIKQNSFLLETCGLIKVFLLSVATSKFPISSNIGKYIEQKKCFYFRQQQVSFFLSK